MLLMHGDADTVVSPSQTDLLFQALVEKGIPAWVDYWGFDVSHDWPWWFKQVSYFVPELLK